MTKIHSNYFTKFLFLTLIGFFAISCNSSKGVIISDNVPTNEDEKVFFADGEKDCPDLVIESLKIVKRSKSKMTIAYTLTNKGAIPVNLLGKDPKKDTDNVAIKMYFSSDEAYERGDILIGGDYVNNKSEAVSNGMLKPGKSCEQEVTISIKTRTSFTPYIVFDVDAWQTVQECDETNNQKAILVD